MLTKGFSDRGAYNFLSITPSKVGFCVICYIKTEIVHVVLFFIYIQIRKRIRELDDKQQASQLFLKLNLDTGDSMTAQVLLSLVRPGIIIQGLQTNIKDAPPRHPIAAVQRGRSAETDTRNISIQNRRQHWQLTHCHNSKLVRNRQGCRELL